MPAGEEPAPGFFEQFTRTRASFRRLIGAHVALLRAELGEILAELRTLGIQAAIILGLAILLVNMLYVGGLLFVGEWLFGSIGWGFAHGVLLPVALVVAIVLVMLGATLGPILGSLLVALLLTVGLALLLGSNVLHDTGAFFAQQLASPLNSAEALAALIGAVLIGVPAFVIGWRIGGIAGALVVAALGAFLGGVIMFVLFSTWTLQPAVAFAITIGLLLWSVLAVALAYPSLDPAERFGRLRPKQTMEAVNETRDWLGKEWQRRRPKLGRR